MHLLRKALWWTVRLSLVLCVLGGVLVVAIILSPRVWLAEPVEPIPPTPGHVLLAKSAAQTITVGDLVQARKQIEEALTQNPDHAPALLLQACMALEEGDSQAVEAALVRLRAAAPERLEAEMLTRLLAHRTRAPAMGWRRAFLLAWTELGRPSFLDSTWLMPEVELPATRDYMPEVVEARPASAPVRLALVLAMPALPEEDARWLVEHLSVLKDPALVQAASVRLLVNELPLSLRTEAHAAVRRRLAQLVEASPGAVQPRLLLLWAEAPDWDLLSREEMEALEAIAALPRWKETSFMQTFLEVRARLQEAGVPNPGMNALRVARMANNTWGVLLLAQRAEVTRSYLLPSARHRLGRILWNIGSLLQQDSMVLVRNTGLQLMSQGAADMGDEAESERAGKALEERLGMLRGSEDAALERWPLPSLWEEVAEARARNEWEHWRELAREPHESEGGSLSSEP